MTTGVLESVLPSPAPRRVLAFGAWLKNRACLIEGERVLWSLGHGDLGDPENCKALERSIEDLLMRVEESPEVVAHDLHPDFFSTRLARDIAMRFDIPAEAIQHHHAHIGVALAELGLYEPVIGLALDGVGLGTDGGAWGGEVLWVCGASDDWRRLDHLPPLALPGGDAAAREPWRMAASVLFALGRGNEIEERFAAAVGVETARGVHTLLQRDLRCPRTTSAGRWFDAAAGALGLSICQTAEAEAAQLLENLATEWLAGNPEFVRSGRPDLFAVLTELLALAAQGPEARARGAALFHLALVDDLAQRARVAAEAHEVKTVVLAGGCFFNRLLRERLTRELQDSGLNVLRPLEAGCGDAGIALGQAWLAAWRN